MGHCLSHNAVCFEESEQGPGSSLLGVEGHSLISSTVPPLSLRADKPKWEGLCYNTNDFPTR